MWLASFLSIYTTNVTGHVANFSKELAESNFYYAKIIALWMFLFFFGAFFSSILTQTIGRKSPRFSHTAPLIIEAIILLMVGYIGEHYPVSEARNHFLSGCILFAMGMQNAMVTMVSGYVVRTTHLTGLFTDLGIELSKLLYSRKKSTPN